MDKISFDISKVVKIYARCNESGALKTITFILVDGSAYDIRDLDFKLIVYKHSNSDVVLFTLAIGKGLSVSGSGNNVLEMELSEENATQRDGTYFFKLFSVAQNKTWLNGPFYLHRGEFDGVNETDEVVVADTNNLQIVIHEVIMEGYLKNCGFWDASGNAFPSTGGTGPSGAIRKNNIFILSPGGTFGGTFYDGGTIFMANVNDPADEISIDGWSVL